MTTYFPSRYHANVFHGVLAFATFLLILKSCWKTFDLTTSSRLTNLPMGNLQSATTVNPKDTTKKYIYVFTVQRDSADMAIRSLNQIMSHFGESLSVDQANNGKQLLQQQFAILFANSKQDSIITITQPKK